MLTITKHLRGALLINTYNWWIAGIIISTTSAFITNIPRRVRQCDFKYLVCDPRQYHRTSLTLGITAAVVTVRNMALSSNGQNNNDGKNNKEEPKLEPSQCAVDYFDDAFFYNGDVFMANYYSSKRQEMFQNKTVGEVLDELTSEDNVTDLFNDVGISSRMGRSCWEANKNFMSFEDILNNKILCLDGSAERPESIFYGKIIHHDCVSDEIKQIKESFVEIPSYRDLRRCK